VSGSKGASDPPNFFWLPHPDLHRCGLPGVRVLSPRMGDEPVTAADADPSGAALPSPPSPEQAPPPSLDPQRLLRIAGVTREVLEEARRIRPEPGAIDHLRKVHGKIRDELRVALPGELYEELDKLTPDIRDGTLEELALGHAEILGWLEGLFQGTQLAIQLHAAQALQERMRPRLPQASAASEEPPDSRYL
jgi:hypothetical protein